MKILFPCSNIVKGILEYWPEISSFVSENVKTWRNLKIKTEGNMKTKMPDQAPTQVRIAVYRSMFNYNTSVEGTFGLISMLGRFKGDDAAKLLTYHFTRACSIENENNHMIRGAIIEALGESESRYALECLLSYAKYNDHERVINRILGALLKWDEKIHRIKVPKAQRDELDERVKDLKMRDAGGRQYG